MYENLKNQITMKKLAVILLLTLCICFSGFTENTKKKSRKNKVLLGKIEMRLDSILQTQVYETINGHKYHRFSHGVLTSIPDTIVGVFIVEQERSHFKFYDRGIFFSDIKQKRKIYRRELKQLLGVLKEPY